MLCRAAVVSLLSFCAWKRIKAEPPPGSHFTRDRSALLAFVCSQSGFFVIQWAYLRSEEEDRFVGTRYLSCDSSQRWKEDDFPWRRQPERSSTQVSWLCYRQSAARLPKPFAVIAKKNPALAAKESEPDYYQINLADWLCWSCMIDCMYEQDEEKEMWGKLLITRRESEKNTK